MTKRAMTSWADDVLHGWARAKRKNGKLWNFVKPTPFQKSKCNTKHDVLSDAVVTLSSFRGYGGTAGIMWVSNQECAIPRGHPLRAMSVTCTRMCNPKGASTAGNVRDLHITHMVVSHQENVSKFLGLRFVLINPMEQSVCLRRDITSSMDYVMTAFAVLWAWLRTH
jgi:hypothetical protein